MTITLVAALGLAHAQSSADPCDAATFNPTVCKAAVRQSEYCSGGAKLPVAYNEKYPYYYGRYRDYISQGGVATSGPAEICPGHFVARGGFGATGAGHGAGA